MRHLPKSVPTKKTTFQKGWVETMRTLVITSCTGEKAVSHDRQLTLEDFRTRARLRDREAELENWRRPAGEMYTGDQHVHLMKGVRALRTRYGADCVNVSIVSAGYGLVPEDRLIAPYNVTFNSMTRRQAVVWARQLNIATDVRDKIKDFPLVVFLLGATYLDAIEPPITPVPGQRLVFLAKPSLAGTLAQPGVTVVPAGKPEATAYGSGLVALKGRMFELFALGLVRSGLQLWEDVTQDDSPNSFLRALRIGGGSR